MYTPELTYGTTLVIQKGVNSIFIKQQLRTALNLNTEVITHDKNGLSTARVINKSNRITLPTLN